jgi:hypothetical protein
MEFYDAAMKRYNDLMKHRQGLMLELEKCNAVLGELHVLLFPEPSEQKEIENVSISAP